MSATATKEISDWLEQLGMSEYAQRFAENRIDLRYVITYALANTLATTGWVPPAF